MTGDSGCFGDLVTCNPCRLSFRFTLVLLCIVQVVVSVGIVWYLGYRNSTQLIGTLSDQLRQTALVEITGQMHDQLARPMRAVNQLEYSMRRNQPHFGGGSTILNVTGLFADLSFIIFNFPQISGAGCSAPNNAFIGAINISAYLSAGASPDTTNGVTSGFAYSYQDVGQTFATYTLPPNSSTSQAQADPNLPLPDYNETNTIADLGALWYIVSPFAPSTRPQFLAAIHSPQPGDFVWSPVYQLAKANTSRPQQTQSVIAAAKAYITPAGQVGFVCFASIFLSRMGDLLRSLSIAYGPSGFALVLDANGVALACSDNSIMTYTSSNLTQPIFAFSDVRLQAISAPLLANGILPAPNNRTSPTSDFVFGGVFFQNDPAFPAVAISISGSDYHLQATRLNTTGLDWVIVVVTKDTDFDGDLASHELVVGLLSMMVLILAIVVMVAVTQCLNRPLTLVVRYMSQVAKMGRLRLPREASEAKGGVGEEPSGPPAVSRSAEHLKQLKEIYAQWRAAVALSFDDDELEISKSRSSRSSAALGRAGTAFSDRSGRAGGAGAEDAEGGPIAGGGGAASGGGGEESAEGAPRSAASSVLKAAWWSRLMDKSAICLMREVEDMQLTFHSMLYQLTKMTAEVESTAAAKRHFVAYVFHEVRVPLNAVMLGIADLRSSCGSSAGGVVEWTEEQRDVLDIVHEQSQVVGRILNDVLSLHKIEDGALTLQFAPFSLESMILSTMQSFQPGIHDKQIHYTAQLQTVQHFVFSDRTVDALRGMPQVDVVGDKYRLRQVLANFLSNAIKFTPHHGNVHVSLQILPATPLQQSHMLASTNAHASTNPSQQPPAPSASHSIDIHPSHSSTSPGNPPTPTSPAPPLNPWPIGAPSSAIFRIAVRDTGVGVSADNQKKLFSPYMQILPGELQKGAGTGLGLSISLNLIRIHGGEIGYATPDDGVGSEFYMEVPMEMIYRGVRGSKQEGATPSGSVRAVHGEGGEEKRGGGEDDGAVGGVGVGGDLEDDDEDGVIGALPLSEERQEEDAIIREITDLQQLQQRYSATPSSAEVAPPSHHSPLYVSRPNIASPDSSMRVLTQQRMHAAHLRQSSHTPLAAPFAASPSLLHSSRRLVALARIPVAAAGALEEGRASTGEESSVASSTYSSGSRSVSLVMNDAHGGPSASPLMTYKRSPLLQQRRMVSTAASPLNVGGSANRLEEKEAGEAAAALEEGTSEDGDSARSRVLTPVAGANSGVHTPPLPTPSAVSPQPQLAPASALGAASLRRLASAESITPPHRGSLNTLATLAPPTPNSAQSPTRSDLYITLATYGHGGAKGTAAAASSGSILSPLRLTVSGSTGSAAQQPSSRALQALQNGNAGDVEVEQLTAGEHHLSAEATAVDSNASASYTPSPSLSASATLTSTDSSGGLPSASASASSSSTSQLPSLHSSAMQPERAPVNAEEPITVRTQLLSAWVAPAEPSSASPKSPEPLPSSPTSPPPLTSVTSPLAAAARSPAAGHPPVLSPTLPSAPLLRVLVAEDSLPNLKLLLMLLRKMKVECVGVENGQLAVDAFRAWREHQLRGELSFALPFDLLLIDGNMPVLGGIAATRQLRAMGVPIPIYAVTGNAMAEDTEEFIRAGANSPVLTKPVQQKELKRIIETQQLQLKKEWKAKRVAADSTA